MKALALDLGASGGKILSGDFDGNILTTQEIHRFPNPPIQADGHLVWDVPGIYANLLEGLRKAAPEGFSTFGVDSFCNDYALLDANDAMIPPVYTYRDTRTEGMPEWMDQIVPPEELYQRTGNQRARFNTLVQLVAETKAAERRLERTKGLLFLSDLLNYYLCGVKTAEFTTASVSQLLTGGKTAGIPPSCRRSVFRMESFLRSCLHAGCSRKPNRKSWIKPGQSRFTICTVGHHDTASAVAAMPSLENHFAYISSGTWSLMGVETDMMITSDAAYQYNFANEGGVGGRNRFLKNIMGLWLLQECQRQFSAQGMGFTFDEMDTAAKEATPFRSIINPDDPLFFQPGDMIGKVQSKCREWNQPVPETVGEVTRCIQESLALTYRATLEKLEEVTGFQIPSVHIIGGGARSDLLNQFAASAMRRPVFAGPYEAAALGNICAQMIAAGEMTGLEDARRVIRSSVSLCEYLPEMDPRWDDAYDRYLRILSSR